MTHRPLITLALSLVLGALAALLTPGCSEDGMTANCHPIGLYNVGAAGERNAHESERLANVDAGCVTDLGDASLETP